VSRPRVSPRQARVLGRLYLDYGWSAVGLAGALGLGRRSIENALRRAGVELQRRGNDPMAGAPDLNAEAARAWFFGTAPGPEEGGEPSIVDTGATLVFRRRRCQACGRLAAYATSCPGCGQELNWRGTVIDADADELRRAEERRP
jgi:RNA polymerase subunit RPABC4/transcription elongation factor Spt4